MPAGQPEDPTRYLALYDWHVAKSPRAEPHGLQSEQNTEGTKHDLYDKCRGAEA